MDREEIYAFLELDGDCADNQDQEGQFTKYRAVEVFSAATTEHHFTLFHSASYSNTITDWNPHNELVKPQIKTVSSRCPEKPSRVSNVNSFYTKENDFENIQVLVEKALRTVEEDYDFTFYPTDCMWKCKYFQGSNIREVYVSCFWDSFCEDHLIEVKRVKGSGLLLQQKKKGPQDLFNVIQSIVMSVPDSRESIPSSSSKKTGGKLRGPLPVLSGVSSKDSLPETKERFLQGLEPMLKMASSANLETRLEAAKMLCDLSENENKSFLFSPECQDIVFQTLEYLLSSQPLAETSFIPYARSEFEVDVDDGCDDAKQLAVMAFCLFAEYDVFQECFLHLKHFDHIISLVSNDMGAAPYNSIQMRRCAAKGLSQVVDKAVSLSNNTARLFLTKQLQGFGYRSADTWNRHCEQLGDSKLKMHAQQIGLCF